MLLVCSFASQFRYPSFTRKIELHPLMSAKNANIAIPVDLTNPGQFFACCGLLELADRLWHGS